MTPFIATVLLVLPAPGEAVAAEGWRRPLDHGQIARPFAYDRAAPFAAGARRGIDMTAAPGTRVRAVCGGVVGWAGRVPRWGRGVTLRCPRGLVATQLGLASIAVEGGEHVAPGATLGRLWARGVLRIGARREGERFGWIDPEPLFEDHDPSLPLLVPPVARRPTTPRIAPRPALAARRAATRPSHHATPLPVRHVAPLPAHHLAPSAHRTPPVAAAPPPVTVVAVLAGLGLLLVAAGTSSLVRARRRRASIAEIAVVQR